MNISSVSAPSQALAASIQKEALETPAQTRAEAGKGDMQAIRKLAKATSQSAPQPAEPTPQAAPASTGTVINVKA